MSVIIRMHEPCACQHACTTYHMLIHQGTFCWMHFHMASRGSGTHACMHTHVRPTRAEHVQMVQGVEGLCHLEEERAPAQVSQQQRQPGASPVRPEPRTQTCTHACQVRCSHLHWLPTNHTCMLQLPCAAPADAARCFSRIAPSADAARIGNWTGALIMQVGMFGGGGHSASAAGAWQPLDTG